MTRSWLVVLVLVLVAGCKGEASSSDCAAAVEVMITKGLAHRSEELENPKVAEKVAEAFVPVKAALATRCREDGWSGSAIDCLRAAGDAAAIKACERKHLTVEQQANAKRAVADFKASFSRDVPDKMLARMAAFKDRMCACTDQACADKVMDDMTAWGKETALAGRTPEKPTDEQLARTRAISEELTACAIKAKAAGAAPPP